MQHCTVTIAWKTTGQVCHETGKWYFEGEPAPRKEFTSLNDAVGYCHRVVNQLPFVLCYVSSADGGDQTIMVDPHLPQLTRLPPGDYRVRLFQWISQAVVNPDGSYLHADQEEVVPDFPTYRLAHQYARKHLQADVPMEPWIYGPDGNVMQRGGTDVTIHDSGEYTLDLAVWQRVRRWYSSIRESQKHNH